MKLLITTALALGLVVSTGLDAEAAGKDKTKRIAKMDVNKDGQVSLQEFMHTRLTKANKRFLKLDLNKDGRLSTQEFAASKKMKKRMEKNKGFSFAKLDKNKDGHLVLEEFSRQRRISKKFARIDTNGDGMLSQAELLAPRARKK